MNNINDNSDEKFRKFTWSWLQLHSKTVKFIALQNWKISRFISCVKIHPWRMCSNSICRYLKGMRCINVVQFPDMQPTVFQIFKNDENVFNEPFQREKKPSHLTKLTREARTPF